MLGWLRKKSAQPAAVSPGAVFRRAPHVAAAGEGERTVLLDPRAGEYFGLDEVATRVWELLDGATPVSAIVDALEAEYDAPRAQLESDCSALLARLAALGVVAPA
jgi:hypothetical protein